jgi:hypothetical protein
MKLHVVFDNEGKIVAAARLDDEITDQFPPRPRIRPLPNQGHQVAELFVPPEHSFMDLAGVCQRLQVDVTGRFPVLKLKE